MLAALYAVAGLSGLILIVSVLFQKSKSEGFAALGGGEGTRYKKGSWDDFLERITKWAAVAWTIASLLLAIAYYKT
jgi:protein translocase SecG subunit